MAWQSKKIRALEIPANLFSVQFFSTLFSFFFLTSPCPVFMAGFQCRVWLSLGEWGEGWLWRTSPLWELQEGGAGSLPKGESFLSGGFSQFSLLRYFVESCPKRCSESPFGRFWVLWVFWILGILGIFFFGLALGRKKKFTVAMPLFSWGPLHRRGGRDRLHVRYWEEKSWTGKTIVGRILDELLSRVSLPFKDLSRMLPGKL